MSHQFVLGLINIAFDLVMLFAGLCVAEAIAGCVVSRVRHYCAVRRALKQISTASGGAANDGLDG